MEKQLDRMEQVEKPSLARKRMRLDLELHKWRCEVIIEAINLTKRYADQIIIKDANSHIDRVKQLALFRGILLVLPPATSTDAASR